MMKVVGGDEKRN